ncbi:hypothetical protein B0I35DRAFT_68327 [Stachybotrys elegans]|uniref:Adhesin domain-containing protein n=1 Tax=Stachybotrys elegans TaxID=80388 RepID=A0A8K0SLP8_9HYPO|nr:hypothetical protein B0I35DRAFT_68327 [Stachybotrys elegans]
MSAPYSDDLYSGDTSDGEHEELLSPSDGYFHGSSSSPEASRSPGIVPSVPDVLVEDPTLREQSIDKAREAAQEQRGHDEAMWASMNPPTTSAGQSMPYSASPPLTRTHQHQHRRSVDEDFASDGRNAGHTSAAYLSERQSSGLARHSLTDAPPAYSPPVSPIHDTRQGGYQTFAQSQHIVTMGRPHEGQALIARGPESMGGSSEQPEPSTNRYIVDGGVRRRIMRILGLLVILSVFFTIFGIMMRTRTPGTRLPPDPPKTPKPPLTVHDEFKWHPPSECLGTPYYFPEASYTPIFGRGRSLEVMHATSTSIGASYGSRPFVFGEVILRPTSASSPGSIKLEVISNDENLRVTPEWNSDDGTLHILTPSRVEWTKEPAPCIQIRATVGVPQHAQLERLKIITVSLNIDVVNGLSLTAKKGYSLQSISGDVTTPFQSADDKTKAIEPYALNGRDIHIASVSGNIKGWYPLFDKLEASSVSGDISIDVDPKDIDPARPKPAELTVGSHSGVVIVRENLERFADSKHPIPSRDYVVSMKTVSGDINAEVAITSQAMFKSTSGHITLRLWPVLNAAHETELTTDTKSGHTTLGVLEPFWTDASSSEPALSHVISTHTSIGGHLKLVYPSAWEGTLWADTLTGSQSVRGEGLHIINRTTGFEKSVVARKGKGSSELRVQSVSGEETVQIGPPS